MKIHESFEDENNCFLVMDKYSGGELMDTIVTKEKFNEKKIAKIMKQILRALCYCHANNIVHR